MCSTIISDRSCTSGGFCPQLYLWLSLWSAKHLCPGYFTVTRTICSNFFCFCFVFYFLHSGVHPEISLAVSGIIFGEFAAAGYSLFSLKKSCFDADSPYNLSISKSCSELLRLSVPLTVNRTAIAFLQGIEAASIPVCLELASHNASEALSIYGVLTGMALPCILFPCALTNSISLLLIPAVAQKQAKTLQKRHYSL